MSEFLSVEISGAEAVYFALDAVAARAEDLSPSYPKISTLWYAHVDRWLESEGGGSYDDLTAAYARRKEKKYGPKKILQASGAMKEAVTSKDAADSFYDESPRELTMGATGRSGLIARAHQDGKGSLPVRTVFNVTDELAKSFVSAIAEDLTEYARSLGFATV